MFDDDDHNTEEEEEKKKKKERTTKSMFNRRVEIRWREEEKASTSCSHYIQYNSQNTALLTYRVIVVPQF